jgi:hypothetical protein
MLTRRNERLKSASRTPTARDPDPATGVDDSADPHRQRCHAFLPSREHQFVAQHSPQIARHLDAYNGVTRHAR